MPVVWGAATLAGPTYVLFYGQMVPLLIGVFMVARHGRGREPAYGAAVAAATLLLVDLTIPQLQAPGEIAFHWIVTALVFVAGAGLRTFERRAHESTRRAVEAEVAATEQAARAVLDERTRIARELHDIVAHAVSSMVVQAGAAEQAVGDDGFRDRALAGIRATGTDALAEMRRLVTMLRDDDDRPALAPQPRLTGLAALVEQACAAGTATSLTVLGDERPLPAGARPRGVPHRAGGTDERPPPRRCRPVRRHAWSASSTTRSWCAAGFRMILERGGLEVAGEAVDGVEGVRAGHRAPARRGAHGRADAADGRHREPPARSWPARSETRVVRADDVRPRRVRLRGRAGRGQRLPAQGHLGPPTCCTPCGVVARGDYDAGAGADPAAPRPLRVRGRGRAPGRPSSDSPAASSRC